jgi:hypothetical protein
VIGPIRATARAPGSRRRDLTEEERATGPIEQGVYDPDSTMLHGFLAGLSAHLRPGGEGWLILSDLAEHLGLRTRQQLLDAVQAAHLRVVERIDTKPGTHGPTTPPTHCTQREAPKPRLFGACRADRHPCRFVVASHRSGGPPPRLHHALRRGRSAARRAAAAGGALVGSGCEARLRFGTERHETALCGSGPGRTGPSARWECGSWRQ